MKKDKSKKRTLLVSYITSEHDYLTNLLLMLLLHKRHALEMKLQLIAHVFPWNPFIKRCVCNLRNQINSTTDLRKLRKLSHCMIQGDLCTSISNLPCVVRVMNNASGHIAVPSQKCITAEWQEYHTETGSVFLNKLTLAEHFLCQRHLRYLISVSFRAIIQPEKLK